MTQLPAPPANTWATLPGRPMVSLSGGKDSTALAIYLRDTIPQLEYSFCDTHKELPETYAYLVGRHGLPQCPCRTAHQ